MITYDLTTVELCNMLEDNLYPNAKITYSDNDSRATFVSKDTMTYAYVWAQHQNLIVITLPTYESLLDEATPNGYTALAIVSTPDGIFEFNLSMLKLEFEAYSDEGTPDIMVAELPFAKGKRILEFYPDFDSQEEYIDALMGNESLYDESDTW